MSLSNFFEVLHAAPLTSDESLHAASLTPTEFAAAAAVSRGGGPDSGEGSLAAGMPVSQHGLLPLALLPVGGLRFPATVAAVGPAVAAAGAWASG